jgi:oxygen-independent coproporphyrinogen-3 oxidase
MGVSVEEIRNACQYDEAIIDEMATDGLLSLDADQIMMNSDGRPFVRCVAAALDPLMKNSDKQFSRPI